MGSVNISITEGVYLRLKKRKRGDESFSELLDSLISQKDISRCFGLLSADKGAAPEMKRESEAFRKGQWRDI